MKKFMLLLIPLILMASSARAGQPESGYHSYSVDSASGYSGSGPAQSKDKKSQGSYGLHGDDGESSRGGGKETENPPYV